MGDIGTTVFGVERAPGAARFASALLLVIAAACASACSGGGGESSTAESRVDEVNGTLLATVTDGAEHRVQFYDFGYGVRGWSEMRLESDSSWLGDIKDEEHSLTQVYQRLRPNGAVPRAIIDADARGVIDTARLAAAAPGASLTDLVQLPPNVKPLAPMPPEQAAALGNGTAESNLARASKGSEDAVSSVREAAVMCSPDELHDNWGAQWFTQNFRFGTPFVCHNGFTTSLEGTNFFSQGVQANAGPNYTYNDFEGDFNVAGTTVGTRTQAPSFFASLWNVTVPARHVLSFNLTGGVGSMVYHTSGSSPCGHLGYSFVYCAPFAG